MKRAFYLLALCAIFVVTSCRESDKSRSQNVSGSGDVECDSSASGNATLNVEEVASRAESGDAEAQREMAEMYETGAGGYEKDYGKAFGWFLKAAEQGDVKAMNSVAAYYSSGSGVGKDDKKAFEWWSKAEAKGSAEAMTSLGACYFLALGVKQNLSEAVRYWRKAAAKGDGLAMYNLGYCMEAGAGVARNRDSAMFFYKKSAFSGCVMAQERIEELNAPQLGSVFGQ